MFIKRFVDWFSLKESLHLKNSKPPYVNEGDVWWVSFGENVGSEISGKSDRFYSKLGRLDDEDFSKVKNGFAKLYL